MIYKPVILLGNGVRGNQKLVDAICSMQVPVLTTWMGIDLVSEDNPAFCGRPGILGQRAANIIQQQATHFFCFGARMDGEQVAYAYDRFAPRAEKIMYDVDDEEIGKMPDNWTAYRLDLNTMTKFEINPAPEWLAEAKGIYNKYRYELDGNDELDPFSFVRLLSEAGEPDDVFALGSSGMAPNSFLQAFKVKKGQRIHNVCTIGAMGADIPMALGSAVATGKRTICYTGDGGFQLNAQELETIHRLHLPVNFFVMNNDGYGSIRVMQDGRFNGRRLGCDPASGFTSPELSELALAYGFMYKEIRKLSDFEGFASFPIIYEVFVSPEWQQFPRVMASLKDGVYSIDNMDDMTPKVEL